MSSGIWFFALGVLTTPAALVAAVYGADGIEDLDRWIRNRRPGWEITREILYDSHE